MPALLYAPPAISIPANSRYSGTSANRLMSTTIAESRAPFGSVLQDDTHEAAFLAALTALSHPGDGEQPVSNHAFAYAVQLFGPILDSIRLTRVAPRVVDDGDGGIRITWRSGEKELRVLIPASSSGDHLIYWETDSAYGTDESLSELSLLHHLGWMHGRNPL